MRIICVIPCRLESNRLSKKMLHVFNKKTLIQHTWESASNVSIFDKVIIAVDDILLYNHVKKFTDNCILTSNKHESGTSRLLEVYNIFKLNQENYDLWVNWQGDEPLITPNIIYELFRSYKDKYPVTTLKHKISTKEELFDPNSVKVVTNLQGTALYFSRLPIPYNNKLANQENLINFSYYKHIGLYVYNNYALNKLNNISKSFLETSENLEQLTFLYNNIDINVVLTSYNTRGIDSDDDILFYKRNLLLY